jgi:4a-hydroxytetrahydrobiopterin dehydratase
MVIAVKVNHQDNKQGVSMTLSKESCEVCRAGAPILTGVELQAQLVNVPDWELVIKEGVEQIQRVFKFKTFKQALDFTNKIGEMAECEGHHPVLITEWGKVTVVWWTHEILGLHKNDLICAAKTDALLSDG